MSEVTLINDDNLAVIPTLAESDIRFTLIYGDMLYENHDYFWINASLPLLEKDGVFIVQTDYHTAAQVKIHLDSLGRHFVNWCIYVNDWGGVPKKGFPRKHDDILIYSNDGNFKWNPERIQIPKVTAGTAFDKKGTGTKTPPDVFYDKPSFSTIASERVRSEGKAIRWQKPQWLMERLLLPFTDEGDYVLDLFMGTGTLGRVCKLNNRNYVGIEMDKRIFEFAAKRIDNTK